MSLDKEVNCPFCKKTFYLKSFRLQEAKTVSCLYCKKRIKLETEERLQHRQTNKAQDGVLTSLSKGEELSGGSVPCDSGSKTDSTEVNSVRSEDSPSKSLIEMQKVGKCDSSQS